MRNNVLLNADAETKEQKTSNTDLMQKQNKKVTQNNKQLAHKKFI